MAARGNNHGLTLVAVVYDDKEAARGLNPENEFVSADTAAAALQAQTCPTLHAADTHAVITHAHIYTRAPRIDLEDDERRGDHASRRGGAGGRGEDAPVPAAAR